MRQFARIAWLLAMTSLVFAGCTQNPYVAQPGTAWQQQPSAGYAPQLEQLQQRASQLDSDNRDLHTQLAQSQQQQQLLQDQVALLQKRLGETAQQLRDAQSTSQQFEQRIAALQASSRHRGGATITANNSLQQPLEVVDIPGLEVRQEQDVVRIELPADRLFQPGTAQLRPEASTVLDQVADVILRHYSRQRVGIEGHTDSSPLSGNPFATHHQLSAAQALTVFDYLTSRNRIPVQQLFTMGHGANHPRASNATPAGRATNRRLELVIYPEKA